MHMSTGKGGEILEIKGIGLPEDFLSKIPTEKLENIEEFSQILLALFSNFNNTRPLSKENLSEIGLQEVPEEINNFLLETSANKVFNKEVYNFLNKGNINSTIVPMLDMDISDIKSFIEESKKILTFNEQLSFEEMDSLCQEAIGQKNETVNDFKTEDLKVFTQFHETMKPMSGDDKENLQIDIGEKKVLLNDLKARTSESYKEGTTAEVKLSVVEKEVPEESHLKVKVSKNYITNNFNDGKMLTEENVSDITKVLNNVIEEKDDLKEKVDNSLDIGFEVGKEDIKPKLFKLDNNNLQNDSKKINTELENYKNLNSLNKEGSTISDKLTIKIKLESTSDDLKLINNNSTVLYSSDLQSITSENTKLSSDIISKILDNQDIYEIITEKFKALKLPEINELRVKLKPKELGDLVVRVTLEKGQINGSITAEKKEIAAILQNHVDNIKQELKNNNVNLTNLSINVNSEENQNNHHGRNFQQNKKQNKEKFIDIINEKLDEKNSKEFSIIV